jgi:hypothetical protein
VRAFLAVGVALLVVGVAGPGSPADAATLPINLTGHADSHIAGLVQSDISFPSTFSGAVDVTASTLSGTLTTQQATLSFNALGLLPVTSTVKLRFNGPVTGTVDLATLAVDVTANFTIELTSFTLLGIPTLDPTLTCETATATSARLTGTFDPATGIVMDGTYSIPAFHNCGGFNDFITLFTSGSGNTIKATLNNA